MKRFSVAPRPTWLVRLALLGLFLCAWATEWGYVKYKDRADPFVPLAAHGFKDATTDTERIRAWWSEHPTANIGLCTGKASGVVVLDVDRHGKDDGETSLQELQQEFGRLPPTCEVLTPNGGRHFYFAHSNGEIKGRNNLRPGIDL